MVARGLLPPAAPLAPDRPRVFIPLPRGPRATLVLPNLGIPARRDYRHGPTLGQCVITGALVIGPVGTDLVDLARHLRQQVGQDLIIRDPGFAGYAVSSPATIRRQRRVGRSSMSHHQGPRAPLQTPRLANERHARDDEPPEGLA